jgi:hypothetical protein
MSTGKNSLKLAEIKTIELTGNSGVESGEEI